MGAPTFWDNNERAQKHIAKLNTLKRAVLPVAAFQKKVDDLKKQLGDKWNELTGQKK